MKHPLDRRSLPALDRRSLLKLAAAAAGAAAFGGCSDDAYGAEEERLLAERIAAERARSGRGSFGPLRFQGYRGLAELPEFELDADGELRLAMDAPGGIDIHTHLGIAALFARPVDLTRRTERTHYFLDCDGPDGPCDLDLDVYINDNFTPEMRSALTRAQLRQLLPGTSVAATHTAANLVAELDRVGFDLAAVLPMAFGLPFGDDLTGDWIGQLRGTPLAERLLLGASVHPRAGGWREALGEAVAGGARIVKLHPEFQRFFPDADEAMPVYAECQRLGVPVIFHGGRSGIEPRFLRKYAMMRRYEPAFDAFPELPFILGHGGGRDLPDAVAVAQRFDNVWLGTSSLGVSALSEALDALGPDKLAFGSDWPFYPLAAPLAKVLLLTRNDPAARHAILRGSAERVFSAARALGNDESPPREAARG